MTEIVIIGAGECGVRAAFTLREQGFDGKLALIGDENTLPYERPPLSKTIAAPPKEIRAAAAYHEAGIDLRLGSRVTGIDPARRCLTMRDGQSLFYDQLLLALGSRPRLFPGMVGCQTMRTDVDAAAILGRLREGARVGIIGGGFIGLELAATARGAGAVVTVFEGGPRVLGRGVPASIAAIVHTRHELGGVEIRTAVGVASATATTITLEDGMEMHFDLVIAGVGAVPNSELAEAAGLDVANGIIVDRAFRTSDPHVFAAGDCCNFPWLGQRVRLESWKAAQDQGAHAATAILGQQADYTKIPWFWSDQYDLSLQVAGLFDPARQVYGRESQGETHLVFQLDGDGHLSAAAGIGPGNAVAKDFGLLRKLMERAQVLDPAKLADPSINLKSLLKAA